jgi:pilus assembly protein CpaB
MANLTRTLAILFFLVAVALGVFAFVLARSPAPAEARVEAHPSVNATAARLEPVVVAARDLPAGKPLDPADLTVRMQASATPGAFGDVAALTGRATRIAVAQGVPVTAEALSSGLADVIEPGERAVAVRIDETNAVGNYVKPGNYVDVFFTLKRAGGIGGVGGDTEVQATQARLLLSKVRVLGVGSASVAGTDAAGSNDANRAPRLAASTAVLAVRTADVDALTLAEGEGRLTLALRNTGDDEAAPPQAFAPLIQVKADADGAANGATRAAAGLSLSALAGGRIAHAERERAPVRAVTAAPAPRGDEIEVIRGGRVERTAY